MSSLHTNTSVISAHQHKSPQPLLAIASRHMDGWTSCPKAKQHVFVINNTKTKNNYLWNSHMYTQFSFQIHIGISATHLENQQRQVGRPSQRNKWDKIQWSGSCNAIVYEASISPCHPPKQATTSQAWPTFLKLARQVPHNPMDEQHPHSQASICLSHKPSQSSFRAHHSTLQHVRCKWGGKRNLRYLRSEGLLMHLEGVVEASHVSWLF